MLAECEQVIQAGIASFVEVGNALLTIRDKKLYKFAYRNFEAYVKEKWSMTRMRAHQLISASEVFSNVNNCLQKPDSESVARPLAKLEPAQQSEAWRQAVETAPKGKVTAKHVESVVAEGRYYEPGINSARQFSENADADKDSDCLFQLRRWWKKATKKDQKQFLRWVESSAGKKKGNP